MAISFNAAADLGNNNGTTNSLSHSYTCGSGLHRYLVVAIVGDVLGGAGGDDITSVTYNGVAMSLLAKQAATSAYRYSYVYGLANPASGANTVLINCTNNQFLLAVAADYAGVSATNEPDATAFNNSTTAVSSITTAITTVRNNCWAILVENSGTATTTAGAGATFRVLESTFGAALPALFDSNGAITPAGSYSMTVNLGTANAVSIIIISLIPDEFIPPRRLARSYYLPVMLKR